MQYFWGKQMRNDKEAPTSPSVMPTLYPADEPALRKNGSYPSGHTLLGWSSALLLTEINPDRADTILARGLMYGESRRETC